MSNLETQLGYTFKNARYLDSAMLHSSVQASGEYERLEFLGDAVLSFVVSDALVRNLPNASEGELSRRRSNLVGGTKLAELGKSLRLAKHLRMSDSVANRTILENTLEAVIGAIYLDGGIEQAKEFILKHWNMPADLGTVALDPKSWLQEWAQGEGRGTPIYTDQGELRGQFVSHVRIEGIAHHCEGLGSSKKNASREAAALMMHWIQNEK